MQICFEESAHSEEPMTQHYLLPTADRTGLAWITETMAFFGRGNVSQVEKVAYLPEARVAASAWGDFAALYTRDEFLNQVAAGAVDLGNEQSIAAAMRQTAAQYVPDSETAPPASRGVLLAVLDAPVRLYQSLVGRNTAVSPALGKIIAGDINNHGNLFPEHYYDLSGKSIEECVLLGLHAMRVARKLNSLVIGEPNVWVFHEGVFRRLSTRELTAYTAQSDALDASILDAFRSAGKLGEA